MWTRVIVFYILTFVIYRLFFSAPAAGADTATPWILLLWFPLGAIGEELGWRGYLHNRVNLVSRIGFNVLVAAIFHLMINVANLLSYAIVKLNS
jgi:membrane protease YdiL (CAAX protease family)